MNAIFTQQGAALLRSARKTLLAASEALFGGECALCGSALLDREEAWTGLCAPCRGRFPVTREERCVHCGMPLVSEFRSCMDCRTHEEHPLDGAVLLHPYHGDYQKLLGAYKFGGHRSLARFFAAQLVESCALLPALRENMPRDLAWVPVPPKPRKIKKEGWDQIECLARCLEKMGENPFPVTRCLARLASRSQKRLNAEERKRNLERRIIVTKKAPETAIIFDDVHTTGSTLAACAAALRTAGTKRVFGVCLFYNV